MLCYCIMHRVSSTRTRRARRRGPNTTTNAAAVACHPPPLPCVCSSVTLTCLNAAGDRLFRVAERKALSDGPQGSRRVEVVNKAAIRVLAWKLWSTSRVTYEIDARGQQAEALAHKQQQLWMPMKTSTPAWEPAEERVTFQLVESVSSWAGSSTKQAWNAVCETFGLSVSNFACCWVAVSHQSS